jgi:hypothetical protein
MNIVMQILIGFVRHALTIFGGVYIERGFMTGDELTTIVAGICTLIGVCWSAYNKIQIERNLRARGTTIPAVGAEPTVPGGEFNPKAEVRRAMENDKK